MKVYKDSLCEEWLLYQAKLEMSKCTASNQWELACCSKNSTIFAVLVNDLKQLVHQ